MLINSIKLTNFRNIKNLKITFDKPMIILYGDNGQGKTNIVNRKISGYDGRDNRRNLKGKGKERGTYER